MRLFVFSLMLCLIAVSFFGCEPAQNIVLEQTETTEDFLSETDEAIEKEPRVQEVSRVIGEYYHSDKVASNIWDLAVYNGRLFLGCGDYNENSGPTPVYSFPLSNFWTPTLEAILETEAVTRFHLLTQGLAVSSTDPTTSWTEGNFFLREDAQGSWKTVEIPYAVHNFSLVEHGEELFCALGVKPDTPVTPVMKSVDGGKTWQKLSFFKDGECFDPAARGSEFCRAYDFVSCGETLYVSLLLKREQGTEFAFYRYEEKGFVYHASLQNKVGLSRALPFARPFGGIVSFADRVYLTSGKLFVSEDLDNFSELVLEDFAAVWDLWVEDGTLFVLTSLPMEDGKYTIKVFCAREDAPQKFSELFSFKYELPCRSMAKEEDVFYFGTDSSFATLNEANSEKIGTLLSVTLQ